MLSFSSHLSTACGVASIANIGTKSEQCKKSQYPISRTTSDIALAMAMMICHYGYIAAVVSLS